MAGVMREEPPQALVCPITLDLVCDPVVDANGHTFERSAIERSLVRRPGISPKTNAPYPNNDARLITNFTVREMVDAFHEATGEGVEPKRIRLEERERAHHAGLRRRAQQVQRERAIEAERERRLAEVPEAERRREAAEAPRRAVNMDQLERDLRELVRVLEDASADDVFKAYAAGKLASLARAEGSAGIVVVGAIPSLVQLLRGGSDEGKANAAAALGMIAASSDDAKRAAVVAAGALPPLVELLRDGSNQGKTKAAGALTNIMANNDDNTEAVFAEGALSPLVQLLRNGSARGKMYAAAALGALMANSDANKATVLAEGGITLLVELLRDEGSAEQVRKTAAKALYIFTLRDAERRQVAELGFTRDQLKALLRM